MEAGVAGINPPPAIVMKSLASKIGMPREFNRKTDEDFTFAPILMSKPSLVVMVIDVFVLSTFTQPPFGIPATVAISSTTVSSSLMS